MLTLELDLRADLNSATIRRTSAIFLSINFKYYSYVNSVQYRVRMLVLCYICSDFVPPLSLLTLLLLLLLLLLLRYF